MYRPRKILPDPWNIWFPSLFLLGWSISNFFRPLQSFCLHVSLTIRIKSPLPCLSKLCTSTSQLITERWSKISPTFLDPLLSFYLHFSGRSRKRGRRRRRCLFFFPWNFTHEFHHDGTTIDSYGGSTSPTRLFGNDFQMTISRLRMLGQIRILRNILRNLVLE